MKYTIMGFNQQKAVEFNLDTDDLLILSYFSDFRDTDLMVCEKFEGKNYYWLKYDALLKNLPILRVKTNGALRKRLKKLQDAKILEHRCKKNKEGTYSFYGIGENYSLLKLSTVTEITVLKSESKQDKYSTDTQITVGTVTEISTGAYENHDGVLTEISTGAYENHDHNINLLKDNSIKNTTLLENREPSSEPSLFDSDNRVRKIIKETLDSMSSIAYDMWFKNTTIKEYENKVSITVPKELFKIMPTKYIKQIEISLDKPIELIEEV